MTEFDHTLSHTLTGQRDSFELQFPRIDYFAIQYNQFDIAQGGQVLQGVAINHDDIGQLANFQGSLFLPLSCNLGPVPGGGHNHLHGRHPCFVHQLQFA